MWVQTKIFAKNDCNEHMKLRKRSIKEYSI